MVLGLAALFVVASLTVDPADGVPIGLGIPAPPLLLLGLTWSHPAIEDPYQFDGLSTVPWLAVTFGPAVLDVVLHGAVMVSVGALRGRRGGPRPR
ncbi:hypothetical protein SAMN05428965_4280 [Geodermatophilus sp. DSM 45219]|nr:hypothetical protein SAMN05428965_4280 [Geodermatophilus sp. DSM 45219]